MEQEQKLTIEEDIIKMLKTVYDPERSLMSIAWA